MYVFTEKSDLITLGNYNFVIRLNNQSSNEAYQTIGFEVLINQNVIHLRPIRGLQSYSRKIRSNFSFPNIFSYKYAVCCTDHQTAVFDIDTLVLFHEFWIV